MKPPRDDIVRELIAILNKSFDTPREILPGTGLVADLGLQSIQVIEYLCEVEDRFELAIDEDTLADVVTVDDLARVVHDRLPG